MTLPEIDIIKLQPSFERAPNGARLVVYDCGGGDLIFGQPGGWWCVGERDPRDGVLVSYGRPLESLERAVLELNCCR